MTIPGTPVELKPGDGQVVTADGVMSTATVTTVANSVVVTSGTVSLTIAGNSVVKSGPRSTVVVMTGTTSVFTGSGFVPDTTVQLYVYSQGTLLGTGPVKADGTYSSSLVIPGSLSAGEHTVRAQGDTTSGGLLVMSVGIVVKKPTASSYVLGHFPRGSCWLNASMTNEIGRLAKLLRARGGGHVTIEGLRSRSPRWVHSIRLRPTTPGGARAPIAAWSCS